MSVAILPPVLAILVLFSAVTFAAPASPPPAAAAAMPLPWLSEKLTVDGNLQEWGSAACVPLLGASDVAWESASHPWPGPSRGGAVLRYAWLPEGLCLAAAVSDFEVVAEPQDSRIHTRDDVEFFIDLRPGSRLGSDPYTTGVYHLLVRPASQGKPAGFWFQPQHGSLPGVKVAGVTDNAVRTVELLVPWPAAVAAAAGLRIGLEASVGAYDPDDEELELPLVLSRRGIADFSRSPGLFTRWELADLLPTGPRQDLGPLVDIDFPAVLTDPALRLVTVGVGGSLASKGSSVRLAVRDSSGKAIFDKTSKLTTLAGPLSVAATALFPFDARYSRDGRHTVQATLLAEDNGVMGSAALTARIRSRSIEGLAGRLAALPLAGRLSQGLASALRCVGAAAALERLKNAAARGSDPDVALRAGEADVHLCKLDNRPLVESVQGTLLDLQHFTALPSVVVSNTGPGRSVVALYCGAVPLAGASVELCAGKGVALRRLREDSQGSTLQSVDTVYGSYPASVTSRHLHTTGAWDLAAFDPTRHVTIMWIGRSTTSYDLADSGLAAPSRLAILPGCPDDLALRMTAWAKRTRRAIVAFDVLTSDSPFVVIGDIRGAAAQRAMDLTPEHSFAWFEPDAYTIRVAAGSRLYTCTHASAAVARRLMGLVLANAAIGEAEVDAIRQKIVADLAPASIKPAATALDTLYCGDVHGRTSYSDGTVSPEGLLLEGLYSNLDFAVVADDNTILGGLRGKEALARHGLRFTVMVGEEIATDSAHANAWPLVRRIPAAFPLDAAIADAHGQGAIVQLSHAGVPATEWVKPILDSGLAGSGFDAWEHVPAAYERWRTEGRLPRLTGSSDSHSGVFDGLERTLVLASGSSEQAIMTAIRENRSAIVAPQSPRFLYGPDFVLRAAWAALAEGKALKAQKERMLRAALKDANLAKLVGESKAGY